MVNVGGRSLHLIEMGSGSPPVVIVQALGGNVLDFLGFYRELASEMRVCVYDRAGLGFPVKSACRSPGHHYSRSMERWVEACAAVRLFLPAAS